ncbi:MAG: cache domain-containing protein [Motiliproteus sp.]
MKFLPRLCTLLSLIATPLFFSPLVQAEDAPPAVLKITSQLEALGNNATLIAAVNAQNTEGLSLDTIKQRDADWRKVAGTDAFMDAMLSSEAGKEMTTFEASQPYFIELFLMDNQGANVAMTSKTSDYWQGDEAKWQQSFKDGVGAVHVGDVEFDESAQAYLVQVSVPVMDGGKAVGAITIGINLDELGE